MNRMIYRALALAACLLMPLQGMAHGKKGASTGTSSSAMRSNTEAMNAFIKDTQAKLDKENEHIAKLKGERNKLGKDTTKYRLLDEQINALEHKVGETKDNIAALKSASVNNRIGYANRINQNIAQLGRMSGKGLSE